MLSNYNDAWFMNESLAFYMSTNTFSNPIFDIHPEQEDFENFGPVGHVTSSESTNAAQTRPQSSASDGQHEPQGKARRFSKLRVADYSMATKQKLNDIRDNLAFSIKGKIFVLELNFKRCIRRLRKFLDNNLPRILSEKRPKSSCYNIGADYQTGYMNSGSRMDRYIPINQEKLFWEKVQPNSTKLLGVQQERLLIRLEKAKRDSHKLFNMDNNYLASYFENGQQDTHRIKGFNYNQQARHIRPASKRASLDRVGDLSCAPAPDVSDDLSSRPLEPADKLTPKSHSPLGSWLDEQASDRCFTISGGSMKGPEAKPGGGRPKKAQRPSTTTTATKISSRTGKRKSRWTSSGRQIKQATPLFGNSERLCIVCYHNAPNIVTLPCKHHDICSDCFIEIIHMAVKNGQYPLKCVLCRQKIERIRCPDYRVSSIIQ